MTKLQRDIKESVNIEVHKKWNDVLFDSYCEYSDGSFAMMFCVCIGYGKNEVISVIIERYDSLDTIMVRLNDRIAWAFASAHFVNHV